MSGTGKPIQADILRSPLGRARGLGSAKAGAAHWWAQRITALALVPLTLWFVWAMLHLLGAGRDDVALWLSGPVPIVLMIALVVATFHHLQLGMQVVIEDYVDNDALRIGSILLVKGLSVLLALACIIAVLRLGL